jgi:hypothetical protein
MGRGPLAWAIGHRRWVCFLADLCATIVRTLVGAWRDGKLE